MWDCRSAVFHCEAYSCRTLIGRSAILPCLISLNAFFRWMLSYSILNFYNAVARIVKNSANCRLWCQKYIFCVIKTSIKHVSPDAGCFKRRWLWRQKKASQNDQTLTLICISRDTNPSEWQGVGWCFKAHWTCNWAYQLKRALEKRLTIKPHLSLDQFNQELNTWSNVSACITHTYTFTLKHEQIKTVPIWI